MTFFLWRKNRKLKKEEGEGEGGKEDKKRGNKRWEETEWEGKRRDEKK